MSSNTFKQFNVSLYSMDMNFYPSVVVLEERKVVRVFMYPCSKVQWSHVLEKKNICFKSQITRDVTEIKEVSRIM